MALIREVLYLVCSRKFPAVHVWMNLYLVSLHQLVIPPPCCFHRLLLAHLDWLVREKDEEEKVLCYLSIVHLANALTNGRYSDMYMGFIM